MLKKCFVACFLFTVMVSFGPVSSLAQSAESRIELEKGSNELVLIARESSTHVSRRYLTVYRR